MVMMQGGFRADQYQPSQGAMPVLPEGEYVVNIVKSELVDAKGNTGNKFLAFTLAIIQGEHTGKKLIARFNVVHSNPQAVEIAMGELTSLSLVVGIPYWQDTMQLHGRPFRVRVAVEPRNDDPSKYSNRIVGYLDSYGNEPVPLGQQGNSGGQPQPNSFPQATPQTQAAPSNPNQMGMATDPGMNPNGTPTMPNGMQGGYPNQPQSGPQTGQPMQPHGQQPMTPQGPQAGQNWGQTGQPQGQGQPNWNPPQTGGAPMVADPQASWQQGAQNAGAQGNQNWQSPNQSQNPQGNQGGSANPQGNNGAPWG